MDLGEVILLAGGYDSQVAINEVEIYSPLGGCQHKVFFKIYLTKLKNQLKFSLLYALS